MKLSVSQASDGVGVLAVLEPTLELNNSAEFRSAVEPHLFSTERLILDLEAVQFIDSSGVGALFSLVREARLRGRRLAIARPSATVHCVFDLVHLARIVPVVASLEDALQSVR